MKTLITITNANGLIILAKKTEYGTYAVNYQNEAQAAKKVQALQANGISCQILTVSLGKKRIQIL